MKRFFIGLMLLVATVVFPTKGTADDALPTKAGQPSQANEDASMLGKTHAEIGRRFSSVGVASATPPATKAYMYTAKNLRFIAHFEEERAAKIEIFRGNVFERTPTAIPEAEVLAILKTIAEGAWKQAGRLSWTNARGDKATLVSPEKESVLTISAASSAAAAK